MLALLLGPHGAALEGSRLARSTDVAEIAGVAAVAAQMKFFRRSGEDIVNHFTSTKTGCACPFDKNSLDCACCVNGGQQCGKSNPHECVAKGSPEDCGQLHNTYLPGYKWSLSTVDVDKDGWGPCQPGCGTSQKYRNIYCIREDGPCAEGRGPSAGGGGWGGRHSWPRTTKCKRKSTLGRHKRPSPVLLFRWLGGNHASHETGNPGKFRAVVSAPVEEGGRP